VSHARVWGSLVLVAAVLIGVSVLSAAEPPAWAVWLAGAAGTWMDRLPAMPWWLPAAIGTVSGLVLALLVWHRRRAGRPTSASGPAFDAVLTAELEKSSDPRRTQATRLAASGSSLGRISRETRLARDAVRTVIGQQ